MILKAFLVTIVLFVVALGGSPLSEPKSPQPLAQQTTDEWNTYYKPYSYSIDYPTINGTANITEAERSIVLISIPDFYIMITSFHSTLLDPQEQAVKSQMEDVSSGIETVSEVQPIYADLQFGYGYFTMDPIKFKSTSEMFFETSDTYYQISTYGITYDKPSMDLYGDRISKLQSSLKFFD